MTNYLTRDDDMLLLVESETYPNADDVVVVGHDVLTQVRALLGLWNTALTQCEAETADAEAVMAAARALTGVSSESDLAVTTPEQLNARALHLLRGKHDQLIDGINTKLERALNKIGHLRPGQSHDVSIEVDLYSNDATLREVVLEELRGAGYQVTKARYGQQTYQVSCTIKA